MNEHESLRTMLHQAVPPPRHRPSEEELWARSRRRRRRRHLAAGATGGAVIAGLVAVAMNVDPIAPPSPPPPAASQAEPSVEAAPPAGEADVQAFLVQCLRDNHFQVEEHTDGSWQVLPAGQEGEVERISRACAQGGLGVPIGIVRAQPDQEMSQSQAEDLYQTYQGVVRCLDWSGIGVTTAPRQGPFVENLMHGRLIWHPYQAAVQDAQLKNAMMACTLDGAADWSRE